MLCFGSWQLLKCSVGFEYWWQWEKFWWLLVILLMLKHCKKCMLLSPLCSLHFDICIRSVITVYLFFKFGRTVLFYHSYSIIVTTIQSGIYRAISLILSLNTAVVVGSFAFEACIYFEFICHFLPAFCLALYHRGVLKCWAVSIENYFSSKVSSNLKKLRFWMMVFWIEEVARELSFLGTYDFKNVWMSLSLEKLLSSPAMETGIVHKVLTETLILGYRSSMLN